MKLLKVASVVLAVTSPLLSSNANANEVCRLLASDSDGDGWGWEAGASCRITPETGVTPQMNHPRTGQPINIEGIFWVSEDFSNKTFSECQGYIVDPNQARDICSTCRVPSASLFHGADGVGVYTRRDNSAPKAVSAKAISSDLATAAGTGVDADNGKETTIDDGNRTTIDDGNRTTMDDGNVTTVDDGNGTTIDDGNETITDAGNAATGTGQVVLQASFDWSVDNLGLYAGALAIDFYGERTEIGVRFWEKSSPGQIGFYTLCEVIPLSMGQLNATPTGNAAEQDAPACIDTDGDGFGWDGSATCIP